MQSDFHHGYDSGHDQAERDHFESYVSSQENETFLASQLARCQRDLDHLDATIANTADQRQSLEKQRDMHLTVISSLSGRVARLREQLALLHAEQSDLRARRKANVPEYSLIGGLFFVVAGLSFVFGDLIISHEIVAYALNIRDNMEAWAFAFGLAMVTVLLKPAYDRLLERPYQADPAKNQVRYERFKLSLAVFALITLAVLGWFRYEAYRTDQLKAAINRSIRQLQEQATPLDGSTAPVDAAILAKIEQQLQQSGELNVALVSSPWAMLSFVLSGLLFALAGAVCLGIGLPVLSVFWFRWLQADRRLWVLRRREKLLLRELDPAEQTLNEHAMQQQLIEKQLDNLPNAEVVQQQRTQLLTLITELGNEHRLALTDRRIAQYNDGYTAGSADRQSQSGPSNRSAQLRPHQAIRQLLRNGFDANH
ncbi:hypothetical protein [Fibrella forsythiae]|uniref:Uncharacterized protein n=1 Tax=Fibrella forsythiae TaxID=2817061 RepID=A0ABS3JMA8_9BACT|nr:hypothetical protein [Fibrella forsythiae]MBO0951135.1 hypothetical protein [Fibrella forsythiae]